MTQTEYLSPRSPTPPPRPDPSLIQLAGYELQSLLGSGGYGEVWKAIGPGGFPKAVKVLHGRGDSEHAAAERKALNRMRNLRHPFLLNIERVEVCNNRLIVVTELADGNLNERYEACRQDGKIGIPRDELLEYLKDAADALDFMYEEHGLQHLDIKPDNLLLQGRHIKLGDFGLAKEVNVTNVSLINGFTPLYAAPELFEGRPGRSSDQYSLAIVYQAMLCGKPPFNGRNSAQLTSQHLSSRPDLSALAPSDRPVISRALSKNASSRYGSCREMIDELLHRRRGSSPSRHTTSAAPGSSRPSADLSGNTLTLPPEERPADVASTPATLDTDGAAEPGLRPALFVSVGGLGTRIVQRLRQAWQKAAGTGIPAWQAVVIDTDPSELRSNSQSPVDADLFDSISIPLRSSLEYRKSRSLDTSWLSRRWLFNIPRSGQVAGMRPLARLAVQDHLPSLRARLQARLEAAVDAEAVRTSSRTIGVPFAEQELDIYIVASVSGGTGSGAVADIALILKELLADLPHIKADVSGLLLTGDGNRPKVEHLQSANTIACLKELSLLATNDPGIPRGFSRAAADLVPFDHTWLLHCGTQLTDADFAGTAEQVAQLLFNTTATPSAAQWRSWRMPAESTDEPTFRLLGLSAVDQDVYRMAEQESASLASGFLRRWLRHQLPAGRNSTAAAPDVELTLSTLRLTPQTLPERMLQELRSTSGQQIEKMSRLVRERISSDHGSQTLLQKLSAELESTDQESGGALLADFRSRVRHRLERDHDSVRLQIRSMLLEAQDRGGDAERGTIVDTIQKYLLGAADCCDQLKQEAEQALATLRSECDQVTPTSPVAELSGQFCAVTGSQVIYEAYQSHVHQLVTSLTETSRQVSDIPVRLAPVLTQLQTEHETHNGIPDPVLDAFRDRLLDSGLLDLEVLAGPGFRTEQFARQLREQAIGFLLTAGSTDQNQKQTFPGTAWPYLKGLGGQHRVMAWLPRDADQQRWEQRLTEEFGRCVSLQTHLAPRVTAACEVADVTAARLLTGLRMQNTSGWEMAERLHTRIDVAWTGE